MAVADVAVVRDRVAVGIQGVIEARTVVGVVWDPIAETSRPLLVGTPIRPPKLIEV